MRKEIKNPHLKTYKNESDGTLALRNAILLSLGVLVAASAGVYLWVS